jgi:predicted nucleotidyltransferase
LLDRPEHDWRGALHHFAAAMRSLYGSRLGQLVLYGSRARGDAVGDSDVDVLVILDRYDDFWTEHDRIVDAGIRTCLEFDVVVSGVPATVEEFEHGGSSLILNARREGVPVR